MTKDNPHWRRKAKNIKPEKLSPNRGKVKAAEKAANPPLTPHDLTEKQLKDIADALRGGGGNVYLLLKRPEFNVTAETDAIFDLLKEREKLFRCEECSRWIDNAEESANTDICEPCCCRINGDDLEDE